MLHNTGPYGPNETPINMGAPVNMTPMSGHINMSHNINNLSKIAHQNVPTPSGHYNLPEYGHYNHSPLGMSPQMGQFPNYQQLGFQHSYMGQNANNGSDLPFPNGMFPMNLNMQSEHNANMMNYAYDKRIIETARQENFKEHSMLKMALNIPQIPNKSYNKHIGGNDAYVHTSMYQDSHHNLDLSMKTQEKLQMDNTRRKNIENTVKLIENILIHSSNQPKESPRAPIALNSPKTDLPSDMTVKKVTKTFETVTETCTNQRVPTKTFESIMNTHSNRREPTKTSEPVINTSNRREQTKPFETVTDIRTNRKEPIPTSLDTEDSTDSDKPSPVNNDNSNKQTSENRLSSEDEDVKPVAITQHFIREDAEVTTDNSIVIKVEKATWADSDCYSPFLKDYHGFHRDEHMNFRIIEGDLSVAEAVIAYKNEIKPEGVFECPHCALLFKHPKRFLIHNKWHTFGLTNIKRMEIAKVREQKRFERKEAKIIERMNSKEVTDTKTDGKVYPCKDCDKVFSAKGSLKNHRQRTHPTRIRECKICHKVITSWAAHRAHLATHTADSGLGFQCSECPKRFKYSHSLAKHSDTHLEKVHACTECPKKFGSQALLKMHNKTHERLLRGATYRCTYCGKGFFESYSLQVHERTHRNERPFACDICNTSFGTNSSLKRHLKVSHSTSKPYQCSVCKRNFSTESIRDRHELRLHGDPDDFKFPCKLCSCKYLKLKDLQKHVYKMHPKGKRKKRSKTSDSE